MEDVLENPTWAALQSRVHGFQDALTKAKSMNPETQVFPEAFQPVVLGLGIKLHNPFGIMSMVLWCYTTLLAYRKNSVVVIRMWDTF